MVRDTGVGIPSALLPRVFDLFVQGERTLDRRAGGLGIGLTLVRRLVELHGGSDRGRQLDRRQRLHACAAGRAGAGPSVARERAAACPDRGAAASR